MKDPALSLIFLSWSWRPAIVMGLTALAGGYYYSYWQFWRHGPAARLGRRGHIRSWQPFAFAAGWMALALALLSPIEVLADHLFLMHMLQHTLLIMLGPPLILFGLPAPLVRWLIQELRLRHILEKLTHPVAAFALYNLNLLIWHVPVFYEAAITSELIHDLQHALFFYTAVIFLWRVIDPTQGWFPLWEWRPARWLYLLISAPPSYILGTILWANHRVLYPTYEHAPRIFNLSALADQQSAGFIMWMHGWMFIMASLLAFFVQYDPDEDSA